MRCPPDWILTGLFTLAVFPAAADEVPAEHSAMHPYDCPRCEGAYEGAIGHTASRVRSAQYPSKMIMGWALLADGNRQAEVEYVVGEAKNWRARRAGTSQYGHNWYPALAALFLAEWSRQNPSAEMEAVHADLIEYFGGVQERTGGWFKWHEGAYRDRPDYPTKDLGMLTTIIVSYFRQVEAQGVEVPDDMQERAERCLTAMINDSGGILYGTGIGSATVTEDRTGARGGFALLGLSIHATDGDLDKRFFEVYPELFSNRIPRLQEGHHVGGLHGLGVTLGNYIAGPDHYKELTDRWLDRLIGMQGSDGGVYIGDDGDAGGERGLLGQDDSSTAAFALMLRLQRPDHGLSLGGATLPWQGGSDDPGGWRLILVVDPSDPDGIEALEGGVLRDPALVDACSDIACLRMTPQAFAERFPGIRTRGATLVLVNPDGEEAYSANGRRFASQLRPRRGTTPADARARAAAGVLRGIQRARGE